MPTSQRGAWKLASSAISADPIGGRPAAMTRIPIQRLAGAFSAPPAARGGSRAQDVRTRRRSSSTTATERCQLRGCAARPPRPAAPRTGSPRHQRRAAHPADLFLHPAASAVALPDLLARPGARRRRTVWGVGAGPSGGTSAGSARARRCGCRRASGPTWSTRCPPPSAPVAVRRVDEQGGTTGPAVPPGLAGRPPAPSAGGARPQPSRRLPGHAVAPPRRARSPRCPSGPGLVRLPVADRVHGDHSTLRRENRDHVAVLVRERSIMMKERHGRHVVDLTVRLSMNLPCTVRPPLSEMKEAGERLSSPHAADCRRSSGGRARLRSRSGGSSRSPVRHERVAPAAVRRRSPSASTRPGTARGVPRGRRSPGP